MKKAVSFSALLVVALLCSVSIPRASAQAVYGSILGTVTDPQGASVVGAKVTVTDQNKGTTAETTTNESGNYAVTHLLPDLYTVKVEAQGFKGAASRDVTVAVDTGSRVDIRMQLGSNSESVEVTAETPQLKTDRADVAFEWTGKQLQELPIFNRNFQSLELLTPGTQLLEGWGHAATEHPQGSKQIFVNGQHFSGTGYELDGTDNQDPILGIIIVNPSLDSVEETKITTQNYDAEFGKALAGIMTAQTRSGTNSFHGSGYFYDLDPVDPAKDPFSNKASPNSWKQFGGSLGGPIILRPERVPYGQSWRRCRPSLQSLRGAGRKDIVLWQRYSTVRTAKLRCKLHRNGAYNRRKHSGVAPSPQRCGRPQWDVEQLQLQRKRELQ